jgi:DNA-binding response OmpR family regulator
MVESHPAAGVHGRVLIVEDETKARAAIAEAIRLEGWEAAEAGRGREMIALLDQPAFAVVVLDWMLPGRDGLELLQHVRARGAHIPVLMERDVWKQTHRFTSLDNVIDVQMMRLRRKIDTEGRTPLIQTIRGVGYRIGSDAA